MFITNRKLFFFFYLTLIVLKDRKLGLHASLISTFGSSVVSILEAVEFMETTMSENNTVIITKKEHQMMLFPVNNKKKACHSS